MSMPRNIYTLLILGLLFAGGIKAQDTVFLKNGRPLSGEVQEVAEDNISIRIKAGPLKDSLLQVSIARIRQIKYAGGYTENYKSPKADTIQLVNARELSVMVAEVGETSVLVRMTDRDDEAIVRISFDSVSVIRYANGYREKYHPLTPVSAPVAVQPKTPAAVVKPATGSPQAADNKTVADNKPPVKEKEKKGKEGAAAEKVTLAIGTILDSASGLSRSVALWEIIRSAEFKNDKESLEPVLVDYPYSAAYAVTGIFLRQTGRFRVYKKGKKVLEFTSKDDWAGVYQHLRDYLQEERFTTSKKFRPVPEGTKYKFKEHDINNMLPGTVVNVVPQSPIADTFRRYATLRMYKDDYAYLHAKEVYGIYTNYNENDLFFFRNGDVPVNLKSTVRGLVFPPSKWLAPSLTYLSCGYLLSAKKEPMTALNLYFAALTSSNSLLASPHERALLKYCIFKEIGATYAMEYPERKYLSALFRLGADLNKAFLGTDEAGSMRTDYYAGISKINKVSAEAESKAREIRGTKRWGAFMAVINTAGAVASASPYDNTTSQAFMDQATTAMTESYTQASASSEALNDAFQDIDNKIDARSYIVSDGSEAELGKSYLAAEITYYLLFRPETARPVLRDFAADKPKLNSLLSQFYNSDEIGRRSVLRDINRQVAEMEARVVATESRSLSVSSKTSAEF